MNVSPNRTPIILEHVATDDDAGERVDRLLARSFPACSRAQIQRAAAAGALLVDGCPVRVSHRVAVDEHITATMVRPEDDSLPPVAESIPLDVIHEDDEIIVINKPAGMVVHPAAGHRTQTLVNALLGRGAFREDEGVGAPGRPGIVHRLDKGTSGLIVIARTEHAHRHLAAQLKERTLTRLYWAVCWGHLRSSPMIVEAPIGRSSRDHKQMGVTPNGRAARTTFDLRERFLLADLIEAHLDTGRTHQIRVHSSHIGHPVVGDTDYGGGEGRLRGIDPKWRQLGRQMLSVIDRPALHAHHLALEHPTTGQRLEFSVDPPPDFRTLLELCRSADSGDAVRS